jgi:hypothetical protein
MDPIIPYVRLWRLSAEGPTSELGPIPDIGRTVTTRHKRTFEKLIFCSAKAAVLAPPSANSLNFKGRMRCSADSGNKAH